jgi:hypothetical protein
LFPIDPVGGGTWIGVNDAGIALALLNRSAAAGQRSSGFRSRGSIIPLLLACDRVDSAVDRALSFEPQEFDLFRLVIVQGHTAGVVVSNGTALSAHFGRLREPRLWTSSSLGDALVERPRAELFDRMVTAAPDGWARGQRRFHRHRWTRHPELSVVMSRTQALTVSRTTIDLTLRDASLLYEPLEERQRAIECSLAGAA